MAQNDAQPSLWCACPQILDENVTVVGLELEDLGLTAFALVIASIFLSGILSLAIAASVGLFLHKAKRGKPAGDLLHKLHAAEVVRLPGILSPRVKTYGRW